MFDAKCLNTISVNPSNTNQVFISSFFNGLLEVNNEIPTVLYNENNSGLESLILPTDPNYVDIRVGPTAFDANGLFRDRGTGFKFTIRDEGEFLKCLARSSSELNEQR